MGDQPELTKTPVYYVIMDFVGAAIGIAAIASGTLLFLMGSRQLARTLI